MKALFICASLSAVVFVAMGMQLGMFGGNRRASNETPETPVVEKKPVAAPKAKFPDELAPSARGEPVAVAAAFEPGDRPHKLVFLRSSGEIHPWHEDHSGYHEDWWTMTVEKVELVVVIGASRRFALETIHYPNGAPPITRYRHDLEAAVVEAKTGQVLANIVFQNMPRQIKKLESWERTALGAPVSYHTVFHWAARIAREGAPANPNQMPFVTVYQE